MDDSTRRNRPADSLRDWLAHLARTGRMVETAPGLDLKFTVAAIAKRLEGRQATYFPSPGGHAVPVVSGVLGARAWIAEAMGIAPAALLDRYRAAADKPLPWREVVAGDAACQQVTHRSAIDLQTLLPLPTHHELDAGAYITAGLVIARNPKTGRQNVSINRLQVQGPDKLGILILPRDLSQFYAAAERDGQALDVAIAIGVDPLTLLASQAIAPLDQDELEIAGALHGAPLAVAKALTNDVRVPADAEIVIEGKLLPHVREVEGPFGEFPKYYGPAGRRQVVAVTAVTHRRNPLYHTIVPGGLEHLLLGAVPREATILSFLQRNFANVLDVHLSLGGTARYHLYVKLKKRLENEAFNVISAAFASHFDVKHVIVVDDDIDIHDPEQVEWAVATRFQADRDLLILPRSQGSRLDPSTDDGNGAKMGLDATKPLDPGERYTVMRIPGEAQIVLDDVVRGPLDPSRLSDD
ncbi:MAG: UbiD family decarboxylase [Alphaproteobacteria bacterium]|nr:UbiD family decarboxylase [Alphaproteobacteria bacterium]